MELGALQFRFGVFQRALRVLQLRFGVLQLLQGAGLQIVEALGAVASVDDLPASTGARYQPDPANHAAYQAAIARQQELYRQFYG